MMITGDKNKCLGIASRNIEAGEEFYISIGPKGITSDAIIIDPEVTVDDIFGVPEWIR